MEVVLEAIPLLILIAVAVRMFWPEKDQRPDVERQNARHHALVVERRHRSPL